MRKVFTLFFLMFVATAFAEIKVGGLFALTGPASILGLPEKQTVELYVEKINKSGGINGQKIDLIVYDTQSVDDEARKKFIRLVQKDSVSLVIGPTTSGESLAIKDLASQYKIPVISLASSDRIVNPLNPFVFKVAPSDDHAVQRVFDYLSKNKMNKVAILTVQNGYGDSGRAAMLKEAKNFNIEILADEKYLDTDKDMTSQLSKINSKKPDAVIVWGVGPAPAIIAKNFRQLNMKSQLVMSHGIASAKFIELAGDAANDIILPAGRIIVADQLADSDKYKKILLDYIKEFEKEFKTPVSTFGGHAYDAINLILKIKNFKDGNSIVGNLEGIKGYIGTYGTFDFSANDHNGLSKDAFVMVKIVDKKWKLINQ
ncbi:MAG: ABC transporter substrate-binding protein [Calditerrivibrio sp.]|nr:ABC transporter substrate-binding protein [Calditerrivibrio sp.]MCA1980147.1 ABC transporter substrate-binding protein [Calditerrivibrio sp.]